jgi:CheY-like chemotaxis protein
MLDVQEERHPPTPDSSRAALDCIHRLLAQAPSAAPSLAGLLAELVGAFGVRGGGLATLPTGSVCLRHSPGATEMAPLLQPDLISAARRAGTVSIPTPAGSLLAAVGGAGGAPHSGWLLWLDDPRTHWTDAEAAALALAAQALGWRADAAIGGSPSPRWAEQLERALRQQRLDDASDVTRRLAHDFGNVLTGILGFSELALGQQLGHHTVLHSYLTEVHRSARSGAVLMQQLRLFSRRKPSGACVCLLGRVLTAEEARLRSRPGPTPSIQVTAAPALPPVAVDAEELQAALAAVLDNACEAVEAATFRVRDALGGASAMAPPDITITARVTELRADDCNDLYGSLEPGPHVEVRVVDRGVGLAAETQRRLFSEPFFSTKSRRRGFGLAAAYGVLHAHRCGIDLHAHAEGGTEVRIILPVAPADLINRPTASTIAEAPPPPVPSGAEGGPHLRPAEAPSKKLPDAGGPADQQGTRRRGRPGMALTAGGLLDSLCSRRNERILVVDDDAGILQFAARALEHAGYRAQTATGGNEALEAHSAAARDPFQLILSDVLMPGIDGIDLVHRLLQRDPRTQIVFMSGNASLDLLQEEFRGACFDVLPKPFSAEQLLRLVRAALDESATPAGALGNDAGRNSIASDTAQCAPSLPETTKNG